MLILALPLEGLRGFGDLHHFYNLAGLGWPYLDFWVEFPPIFPFLSRVIYLLAGGVEHVYDYLLVLVLSIFQAGSLFLLIRLIWRVYQGQEEQVRIWVYFAILAGLAYGWWYFDPLAVFFMLLAINWLLEGQDVKTGIALAIGTLIKLFPIFVLPAVWLYRPKRKAYTVIGLAVGIVVIVYGTLFIASPEMTTASLRSQASKGSWETVWALFDGNYQTGNFGPLEERFDPTAALQPRGNPARISPWLTLALFALAGLWLLWRERLNDKRGVIAFIGLTLCIVYLWSPGWSPQWVLFLVPLILLCLPRREALLMVFAIIFINLLEWPAFLSRGYTWGLLITIPVRTFLLILLAVEMWRIAHNSDRVSLTAEESWKVVERH
jgi:hypothetical protein